MHVELRDKPFDPWREISACQARLDDGGRLGAAASFVGTMRDFNEDRTVQSMMLEHYPGMTDQHLQAICAEVEKRWDIIDCLLLHRVGRVEVGETIVLVAVWSSHRAEAFDACRFMIEDLKARAPFWKKEFTDAGERWVEKNTPGYKN